MLVGLIFILLILVLFLRLLLRENHAVSLNHAREKHQLSESKYFDFHGLSCHYTDQGEGDVLIMVHGLGDSFKIFDPIVQRLSQSYRLVRVDLPGFGLSDVPKSFEPQGEPVEYYRAFMHHFTERLDVGEFHLMGNSLGGLVSWEFALQNQQKLKSLCLISSAGYEMEVVKHNISKGVLHLIPKFLLHRGMPYSMAKKNLAMVIKQRVYRTKSLIDIHYDMINTTGTLAYFIQMLSFDSNPNIKELHHLKTPTLIAWGQQDRVIPVHHAAKFAEDIPNSQTKIYSNCGHYPQVEYSNKFVEDWLSFAQGETPG